jgi:hypothetical protein
MRDAWRNAAAESLDRDHNARWWRRWLHGEDTLPGTP